MFSSWSFSINVAFGQYVHGQNYKVSPELEPLKMSKGDVEISPFIF